MIFTLVLTALVVVIVYFKRSKISVFANVTTPIIVFSFGVFISNSIISMNYGDCILESKRSELQPTFDLKDKLQNVSSSGDIFDSLISTKDGSYESKSFPVSKSLFIFDSDEGGYVLIYNGSKKLLEQKSVWYTKYMVWGSLDKVMSCNVGHSYEFHLPRNSPIKS